MFISCTHGYTTNHDSNIMMILVIKHQGAGYTKRSCVHPNVSHIPSCTPKRHHIIFNPRPPLVMCKNKNKNNFQKELSTHPSSSSSSSSSSSGFAYLFGGRWGERGLS